MNRPFRPYSQITLDERRKIERWHAAKISVDVIAEKLGWHRSTIFRELKRNRFEDPEMRELSGYYGVTADARSKDRRRNLRKLIRLPQLREAIIERIRHGWSPEQVAGRLKLEGGRHGMTVCHETIYRLPIRRTVRRSGCGITCRSGAPGAGHAMPDVAMAADSVRSSAFCIGRTSCANASSLATGSAI
ncbi:helix-turn-helix protein [Phyllobacterium brassicacearum]|nr:helix-turn-helix protein [Phyllobacterium brassicacearum]